MTALGDRLTSGQVQSMLDAVEAAYADRARLDISSEVKAVKWAAERGDERAQELYRLVMADPLFVMEVEQDAERDLRAAELGDWPEP